MYIVPAKIDEGFAKPQYSCRCPVCHHVQAVAEDQKSYVCRCNSEIEVEHAEKPAQVEVEHEQGDAEKPAQN